MSDTFWSYLPTPSMGEHAVSALINVALHAGGRNYKRLILPYMRTDVARNKLVQAFLEHSQSPEDTLIMLDCDHNHPQDILERLAAHSVGVVGALAFMRLEPFGACAFYRTGDGHLHAIATWEADSKLVPCTVVGTGAIAIKRWVFDQLAEKGQKQPYFRYFYPDNSPNFPTEDVYFGCVCEAAGIMHHVDMSLVTPHMTSGQIDDTTWLEWLEEHPGIVTDVDEDSFKPSKDGLAAALETLARPDGTDALQPKSNGKKPIIQFADIKTRMEI